VKDDEFDSLLMQQPHVGGDLHEHEERLRRRFEGFPFFRPSRAEIKARHRQRVASAQDRQSAITAKKPSAENADLPPCTLLLAAAKKRAKRAAAKQMKQVNATSKIPAGLSEFKNQLHVGDFLKWVEAQNLNLVRIWRKLDKDGSMSLTKTEFLTGLRSLRYQGNLQKLWDSLDRDDTGSLSFLEFAPEHAMDLARLKQWALEKFGSLHGLFKAMDNDNNGKVSLPEFASACVQLGLPKRLHDSIGVLFQILDDPEDDAGRGFLSEDELSFLDVWKAPAYLSEKVDLAAVEAFRTAVIQKHRGNALAAWRIALDRDNSMKVSAEEFTIACKRLSHQGIAEADPPCGIMAVYVGIDTDRSGWFTFRDWDTEAYNCLQGFVEGARAKTRRTKVSEFLRSLETEANQGVAFGKFREQLKEQLGMNQYKARLLWTGLISHEHTDRIFPSDILFLDRWNPQEELEEDLAWQRMACAHQMTGVLEFDDH